MAIPPELVPSLYLRITRSEDKLASTLMLDESVEAHGESQLPPSHLLDRYYNSVRLISMGSYTGPTEEELAKHLAIRDDVRQHVRRLAFPGEVLERFQQICGQITDGVDPILIGIAEDEPALGRIPWELLTSSYTREPGSWWSVFRHVPEAAGSSDRQWRIPVVTLMESQPRDLPSLHADEELTAIEHELDERLRKHELQLTRLVKVKYARFQTLVERARPTMLHAVMHGNDMALVFRRANGRSYEVRHDIVAEDLREAGCPSIIVLNVCESAHSVGLRRSLAHRLMRAGAQAVIGMARSITPDAALTFTTHLYRNLGLGSALGCAYARAVDGIRGMESFDNLFWSVPVLYGNPTVVPFPSNDQLVMRQRFGAMLRHVDEAGRRLRSLSPAGSWQASRWRSETLVLSALLREIGQELDLLPHMSKPTRHMDQFRWRLTLHDLRTDLESRLAELRAVLWQLGRGPDPGGGRTATTTEFWGSRSETLRSLDRLRGVLVTQDPILE